MLEVTSVSRSFGGLRAVDAVSFHLPVSQCIGLIGPNGSGKSTLFNIINGLYPPDSGEIRLHGQRLDGRPVHETAQRGIARSFQTPRLYNRLTLLENLAAPHFAAGKSAIVLRKSDKEALAHLLEKAGLADRRNRLAGELSLPERRRFEMVRAQAANPQLILLDEPAGGMTPKETAAMADLIQSSLRPQQSCIIVEHKIDMIAALCARTIVLNHGQKIADGPTQDVLREDAVITAYIGRKIDE